MIKFIEKGVSIDQRMVPEIGHEAVIDLIQGHVFGFHSFEDAPQHGILGAGLKIFELFMEPF
jgi:hypothetical protein